MGGGHGGVRSGGGEGLGGSGNELGGGGGGGGGHGGSGNALGGGRRGGGKFGGRGGRHGGRKGGESDDDNQIEQRLSGRKGSRPQIDTSNLPPCNEAFDRNSIKWHNYYRALHGAPKVVPDKKLCQFAQDWANKLAAMDTFKHRRRNPYGENIFMSFSSNPKHKASARQAVKSWYSEIKDYSFNQPRFSGKTGHFTQVVWKNSLRVGSGRARSKSGKSIVVSNYAPRGNVRGKYPANVLPLVETHATKA